MGRLDMNLHLHRRRDLLRVGLALAIGTATAAARGHEFFTPNLTVIHPWAHASADGDTTAVVSMTFEDVVAADHLIGAETPLASGAELGGAVTGQGFDFAIEPGHGAALAEDGVYLRLTGLKAPLQLGREYPLTLVFAKAGRVKAALLIDYPPRP